MRCTDCGFYECALRTPLGGCLNGEKVEHQQIITTPDTRPFDLGNGPWDKGYQPSGIQDPIKEAAIELVTAVEKYVEPKPGDAYCSRNEVLLAKNELKKRLAE